jgi:hypothetical protein
LTVNRGWLLGDDNINEDQFGFVVVSWFEDLELLVGRGLFRAWFMDNSTLYEGTISTRTGENQFKFVVVPWFGNLLTKVGLGSFRG